LKKMPKCFQEQIVDNGKHKVDLATFHMRPVPDPQEEGMLRLDKELKERIRKEHCKFCGKKGCNFFFLRDSFYKAIEYNWNTYLTRIDKNTIFEIAHYRGDIFMGASLDDLDPKKNKDYKQFSDKFKNTFYATILSDFFDRTVMTQLWHEKLVQQHVVQNKLTSVEVFDKVYQLDDKSFKVDFDFEEIARKCKVCKKGNRCKYKLKVQRNIQEYMHHNIL